MDISNNILKFKSHTFKITKDIASESWKILETLACIASVSNRASAQKLEQEQKKDRRGRGRGEEEMFLLSPPPSLFFFCSRPNFRDKLARKRFATQAIETIIRWVAQTCTPPYKCL